MQLDFSKLPYLLYEADKGKSNGDGNDTDDATGDKNGGNEQPEPTFTQQDVDRIVNERLERERKKAEERERKAREDAEAKALQDNQQYKELSEKQAKQLLDAETDLADTQAKLESAEADRDRYQKALNSYVQKQREGVPESIGALLDNLDPVAQLDWLTENGECLGGNSGVPATPKAKGALSDARREEAKTQADRYYRNRF